MDTKMDRNTFYSETKKNKKINLQIIKAAPLHRAKHQDRGYSCLFLKNASLTVEASFCATAFLLVLFPLLSLFQMLYQVHRVQMCLAGTVWQYEALGTKLGTVEGLWKDSVLIQWNEEEKLCYVKRWEDIPFIGGRFFGISFYQQMKINAYDGKSMLSQQEACREYVFVARSGRVYHKKRDCVYLNPAIQSVKYMRVDSMRNSSGSRYKLCRSCCGNKHFTDSTVVYLTPYGDCFHAVKDCPGLKRTVRRVELSKLGNMPPCSKCTEKEDGYADRRDS